MSERSGEWFAFSRTVFCRRLTVYDHMHWHEKVGCDFSLASYSLSAVAPLGGCVGLLRATPTSAWKMSLPATTGETASVKRYASLASSSPILLPPALECIDVYTSAGEYLGTFSVPSSTPVESANIAVGTVVALDWTKEMQLYALTSGSFCIFYDLTGLRCCGDEGSSRTVLPHRIVSLRRSRGEAAATSTAMDKGRGTSSRVAGTSSILAHSATGEGVFALDEAGCLYGLLHDEDERRCRTYACRVPLVSSTGSTMSNHRVVPTALAFVPPSWREGNGGSEPVAGEVVVYWGQTGLSTETAPHTSVSTDRRGRSLKSTSKPEDSREPLKREEGVRSGSGRGVANIKEKGRHFLCCITVTPGACDVAGTSPSTSAVTRLAVSGRVVSLQMCQHGSHCLAVLFLPGILYVLSPDLTSIRYALDLRLSHANGSPTPVWGNATTVVGVLGEDLLMCGGSGSGGINTAAAATASLMPTGEDASGYEEETEEDEAAAVAVATATMPLMVWCGTQFLALNFCPSRCFGVEEGRWAPASTVLVSLAKRAAVRCVRLDWGGAIAMLWKPEVDGARVITEEGCFWLQEVPCCLADLGSLQLPLCPAAQLVRVYRRFKAGEERVLTEVRALLASPPNSSSAVESQSPFRAYSSGGHSPTGADNSSSSGGGGAGAVERAAVMDLKVVEGIFATLLDAASFEVLDLDRQQLLLETASFLNDLCGSRATSDCLVDVVRRLRVLRAVREAPRCHMPVSARQFELLSCCSATIASPVRWGEDGGGIDGCKTLADMPGGGERHGTQREEDGDSYRCAQTVLRQWRQGEGRVLVDRLTYLEHYALALDVARSLRLPNPERVLSLWCCALVRQCEGSNVESNMNSSRNDTDVVLPHYLAEDGGIDAGVSAATSTPLAIYRQILQVLRGYTRQPPSPPQLSSMGREDRLKVTPPVVRCLEDAAAEALAGGYTWLALQLLNEIPPGPRKALTYASAQCWREAARCCVIFGDAELIHIVMNGLLRAEGEWAASRLTVTVAAMTAPLSGRAVRVFCACPSLLVWLFTAAAYLKEWKLLVKRLLLHYRRNPAHWALYALVAYGQLQQCLSGCGSRHMDTLRKALVDEVVPENVNGDSEDDGNDHDAVGKVSFVASEETKSSTHVSAEEDDMKAVVEMLNVAGELKAAHDRAGSLPACFVCGASLESDDSTNGALLAIPHAVANRTPFSVSGRDGVEAMGECGTANDIRFNVSSLQEDVKWLRRQRDLETLQDHFADEYSDPHFRSTAAPSRQQECSFLCCVRPSVLETIQRLLYHRAERAASKLRRMFDVDKAQYFYARLYALAELKDWDGLEQLVGPSPPLQKVSIVFASAALGAMGRSSSAPTPPCIGYAPIVELLVRHGQIERALTYVPGVSEDAATRVELYVRLGAPIMAMEAAYVGKDRGLIEQVMRRMPGSDAVQVAGAELIAKLSE